MSGMELSRFGDLCEELVIESKKAPKKRIVTKILEEAEGDDKDAAIAFLTNQKYDDIGIGKATVRKAAVQCFDVTESQLRDLESEYSGLPSAIGHANLTTERLTPRSSVTLSQVADDLEELREASGEDDTLRILKTMLGDYESPKWVAHAILASDGVSLGFGAKSLLNYLGEEYGYKEKMDTVYRGLTPDVIELVKAMSEPDQEPRSEPEMFAPFKPMKAKDKDIPESIDKDEWMVQPKYDGARILVHYDGKDIRAWSRKVNEVTESLPELEEVAESLPDGKKFILDGEAIAMKDDEPQDFQHIMKRFNRQKNIQDQEVDVDFVFFDILYVTGVDGTERPIADEMQWTRHKILELTLPHSLLTGKSIPGSPEEIEQIYDGYLDDGYEGAIVKRTRARYQFDKRSSDWRKLKPTETVDLVITGSYEGEDGLSGTLGGVWLETEDGVSVGKMGQGFKEDDRENLWEQDLQGKIIEVMFEELQKNEQGEYGLRFPRFVSVRPDKDEADTIEMVRKKG